MRKKLTVKITYENKIKELEQEIHEILLDQEIENDIKPSDIRCPYYGCGATFPSSILHDTEFCPECEEPFDHDDIELHLE
jgi:rRNA maturation endonuclease Nob1